jgi:hypothetical protein
MASPTIASAIPSHTSARGFVRRTTLIHNATSTGARNSSNIAMLTGSRDTAMKKNTWLPATAKNPTPNSRPISRRRIRNAPGFAISTSGTNSTVAAAIRSQVTKSGSSRSS